MRAATLMSRRRNVSNCATRHIERLGIDARRGTAGAGWPRPSCMRFDRRPDASSRLIDFRPGRAGSRHLRKRASVADFRFVTMKRVSGPPRRFDACDDPLDAAPAFGPIEELLEAASLPSSFGAASKRAFVLASSTHMPAQRCGRRDAQDVIETVGPTPVENFRTAIMAVGPSKIWVFGQLARIAAAGGAGRRGSPCPRPFWRGEAQFDEAASPSNTTIG